jgi:thioredoxin reductase (NADPH)
MTDYDVIIIGGASAGLTAGMYSARRRMKTLILTKDIGGQASTARVIENYPGFLRVKGPKLMERFQKQAVKSGAEIIFEEVKEIEEKNGEFAVKTSTKTYSGKAVILAFGKTPRSLNVPGEKRLEGKGVSYCATCDMPLFKNKTVAVVGGGNTALDAALYGSKVAKKVYLIHRRDEFRGFEYLVDKVKKKDNVELVLSHVVTEIKGENFVESILVKNLKTNQIKELLVDGVFIEIGSEVKTDFIKNLVKLDDKGYIVITNNCETFYPDKDEIHPGIFAAGDITYTPFRQIVVSAGEGCKAALQAYNYIHGIKEAVFIVDWAKK